MAIQPDEQLEEEFTSRLIELADAVASETPLPADDPTAEGPLASQLRSGRACLERIERFRRSVQNPAVGRTAATTFDNTVFDPDLLPERIGRFEILRELGRGGYGVVFLARDPSLEREVALKVPRPEVMLTAELRMRFLREAKAAAALNHAHIVPVFEAGSVGPIGYIASAFCPGKSLARWLAAHREPVAPRAAAQIVVDLAEAAQHAHGRGVVHRDLKPSNILLESRIPEGGSEEEETEPNAAPTLEALLPLISDFGLAKTLDVSSEETRTTAILGTPAYMAPEQAAGRAKQVGAAADIYALGAILYELLTRRPPLKKAADLATLQAVQNEEPLAPRRLRVDVPRDLEAICLKCLEKEPARRYATATALADDLNRYLAGEPVVAQPIGRAERLARWCRRNPLVAGLTATASLLLIAVAVVTTVGYARTTSALKRESAQRKIAMDALAAEETQHAEAEVQRDRAEANLREALRAVDEYLTKVSDNRLFDEPGFQPLRQELLESAQSYYQGFVEQYGDDPTVRRELAAAYRRVGEITADIGTFSESKDALVSAIEIAAELSEESPDDPANHLELMIALQGLANLERRYGNNQESADAARAVLNHTQQLVALEPENRRHALRLGNAQNAFASAMKRLGQNDESATHYEKAIEILEELGASDRENVRYRRDLALALSNRSGLALRDDLELRLDYTARAISLYEGLPNGEKMLLHDRWTLGVTYGYQGRLQRQRAHGSEALSSLQSSREILEALVADNPSVKNYRTSLLDTMGQLAPLLVDLAQPERAIEVYRDLLGMHEQFRDPQSDLAGHDRRVTFMRGWLASLELQQGLGNPDDCVSDLEAAAAVDLRNFPLHTALGIAYYRTENLESAQGSLTRATSLHPLAMSLQTTWPWIIYRDGAMANYYLAMTLYRLGDAERARCALEKADDWADRFRAVVSSTEGSGPSFEDFLVRVLEPLRREAVAMLRDKIN